MSVMVVRGQDQSYKVFRNLSLFLELFLAISVATINLLMYSVMAHHSRIYITRHELLREACLGKLLASSTDVLCCEIGTFGTTAKDDMNIRITLRMD